jgi:hypothetical protein
MAATLQCNCIDDAFCCALHAANMLQVVLGGYLFKDLPNRPKHFNG